MNVYLIGRESIIIHSGNDLLESYATRRSTAPAISSSGKLAASIAPWTCAGIFAANASKDITVCDATSHDNAVSMGFAFWSVRDVRLVDCAALDNGFAGFNFERVSGSVTLVRPVARDNRWDMRVVSDLGSAVYTIVDPDLTHTQTPGKWTVEVPSTYWKHRGKQRLGDIHLIVDGVERPDLLRIVVPY